MAKTRQTPDDPLAFIRRCVRERRILWTYHVNMRLGERALTRDSILGAVEHFELVESYAADRDLPAYLLFAQEGDTIFHVVFAADLEGDTVRVVTAYRPDPQRWMPDLKTRRMR